MDKSERISFYQAWLCEAIRLQETQWGARDDSKARLLAQSAPTPLKKITSRAVTLSQDSGIASAVAQIKKVGWAVVIFTLVLAVLAGSITSFSALGNGMTPVNVVWAFMTLLAFNLLSMAVWCITMLSPKASGGWLTQFWPWLTRKLARGPNISLAAQAWWSLWHQAQATRWVMSAGTHVIWLTVSLATSVFMLFSLSTREYDFVWETTVLSPDIFVNWVGILSAIPQWFGFEVPDSQIVRMSGSIPQANAEATRILWSSWLLGSLIVYGIIPRAILALLSFLILIKRSRLTAPEITSPYYASVLNRTHPAFFAPDGSPPPSSSFVLSTGSTLQKDDDWKTQYVITAIEPDPKDVWPPTGIGSAVTSTSPIDSRESRQQMILTLSRALPQCLVITCDARHTPDRGTLRLIADLADFAKYTLVWLRHSNVTDAHTAAWKTQVQNLHGIELLSVDESSNVMQWFGRHHE